MRAVALIADRRLTPDLTRWAGSLSASSHAYLGSISGPARRQQSQCARQLAALAAGRLLGTHVGAAEIMENEPAGIRLAGQPAVHVSISHANDLIAACVAWARCGIDVEHCREDRNFRRLAQVAFGPIEAAWIGDSADRFYRLWTLREAALKAGRTFTDRVAPSSGDSHTRVFDGYRATAIADATREIEWHRLRVDGKLH
jgi:4'-phosphopantetheinyl transferase EntD